MNNYKFFKKEYEKKGYFVVKDFFKPDHLKKISNSLLNYKKLKCEFYFDRKGKIRRLEKFYNKTTLLDLLNKKTTNLLGDIFSRKFIIFKDKYNLKPPKGEGFSAHYDGIFHFFNGKKKYNGWYKYSKEFVNVLIPFDKCNKKNGTIQLSKEHKLPFKQLLKKTQNDGTPNIKKSIETKLKFQHINLNIGDLCIFSNRCPHRSDINKSNKDRRILYYTYNLRKDGNNYYKYFLDKKRSKSKFKSLKGKI